MLRLFNLTEGFDWAPRARWVGLTGRGRVCASLSTVREVSSRLNRYTTPWCSNATSHTSNAYVITSHIRSRNIISDQIKQWHYIISYIIHPTTFSQFSCTSYKYVCVVRLHVWLHQGGLVMLPGEARHHGWRAWVWCTHRPGHRDTAIAPETGTAVLTGQIWLGGLTGHGQIWLAYLTGQTLLPKQVVTHPWCLTGHGWIWWYWAMMTKDGDGAMGWLSLDHGIECHDDHES